MKRAGTTGSARGMALYEEEVSWLWGGSLLRLPEATSLLFLPSPPHYPSQ